MNKRNSIDAPDFQMKWCHESAAFAENFYCNLAAENTRKERSRLREIVAILKTETAYIEVSQLYFSEPMTFTFSPHRPGFTLLTSTSSTTSIDYGYEGHDLRKARLENVLFMLPEKKITGSCSAGAFRSVTCSFSPTYAESILGPLTDLSLSQLIRALDMRSSFISSILLRLMNEAIFPGPISSQVIDSLGNMLLVECKHGLLVADLHQDAKGKLTAKHIQIIEDYLSGLTAQAPSVADLAATCGFSDRYFARIFRKQFGCAVSQYIKSVQIARAKSYLQESDLQLKEIAHRLGFKSLSNFSFAFKSATGVTPGQFRKT